MTQPATMSQLPVLGGTGLVSHLYEYLWTKNNLLQTRCMYHKCPPVLIPDTILLKNKQPSAWYFSSLKTGSLQRRSKDLSVSKVVEALIRRQDPNTDIVATFVGSAQGDVQPITEYLTPAGLDYFLSTPPSRRTKSGMLQSFIHPKGTSNFVVRVSWSPNNCNMDSCININKLTDPELEAQDRACTNDEQHCVLIPMSGNVLATQLERLCSCIAEHMHLASQQLYKVTSMVITFKIDSEDRVWLLWCEQMEVGDDQGNPIRSAAADARLLTGDGDEEEEEEAPKQRKKGTKRGDVTFGSPGKSKRPGSKSRNVEADPEFVDSEDEEAPRRRTRADEVDDSDEEPHVRPITGDSEDMDPSDFVLLPKGEQERTKKRTSKKSRQPDSDTDEVSGSEPPSPKVDKKRSTKGKEKERRAESASKEKEMKMIMVEEKKKREEAEKKATEAEEKLRRAEAKARAAEAKLKKAQTAKAEVIPAEKKPKEPKPADKSKKATGKGSSLPKIAAPSPSSSRPSSKGPQQEPLVDIEDEKEVDPQAVANMVEEVVKAADISGGADDAEPEEDFSATADIKVPGDDEKDPDTWDDDLPTDKPKVAEFDLKGAEHGVPDPDDEDEEFGASATSAPESGAEPLASDAPEESTEVESDANIESQAEDGSNVVSDGPESQGQPGEGVASVQGQSEVAAQEQDVVVPTGEEASEDEAVKGAEVPPVHVAPLEMADAAKPAAPPPQETLAAPGEAAEEDGEEKDDAYDPEEYEDKPIENISSIETKAPPPRQQESIPDATTEAEGASAAVPADAPAEAAGGAQFSVEVSGGAPAAGQEAGGALPPPKEKKTTAAQADIELKCVKNVATVEPSAAQPVTGGLRTVGMGPDANPLERNAEGDEIERDLRMVYHAGANQFRSELRVGTSNTKWQSQGMDTVMDGDRVSTNVSCFSAGGEAFSVSSMFDEDGLQPPHMQALMKGQVSLSVEDDSQRCDDFGEMSKAIPDPIPDFHKPQDDSQQTEEKDGAVLDLALPLRKVKGKPDKQRELRVEVICTPIVKSQEPGAEEDPMRLKMELGLPDVLWKHDEMRGAKALGHGDEIPREESENRFLQFDDRLKGNYQSQIESASSTQMERDDVGHALEVVKTFGANAKTLEGENREPIHENIVKNSEWAFDEYMRPETHSISAYSQKLAEPDDEAAEVMEVKFDATFSTDEERLMFAKAQRDKLAKMLGINPECIEIAGVKPGSPITMIRFNIKKSDAEMVPDPGPAPADDGEPAPAFDLPALSISMLETAGEDSHRQLSQRLKASGALSAIPVEDSAVQSKLNQTAPAEVLDSLKAYSRENQPQPRFDSSSRAKGECDESVPGSRFEEANQLIVVSGELESTTTDTKKDKGEMASLDEDGVDRVYKPGREMMTDDQFSSAKVQRRPPKPAKRMLEIPLAHDGEVEEQVKVPFEEVDNTRRLKEQEDELNFLPAQRAAMGPRTAIMAKKDEGLEDHRFDRLDEHDSRMEEKVKEVASKQPSLKLTKAVEETEYELAQKITGLEDPRTTVPCEPAGLSTGDRRQKKKGKNGEKLHKAAIPEHYMAFGTEGESQRLAPSVVTLEKPGAKVADDGKPASSKDDPELLDKSAPDVLSMKFDVSFVDEKSRAQFAEAQRQKLAQLLKIPADAISVRACVPGSPITVVTFEIDPGVVARAIDDAEIMHNTRPFDNPVLDIGVTSAMDESAEAIMKKMKVIVGPKVPIARQSIVPGKGGAALKDKNVKFASGEENQQTPAYMRSREELEARAQRHGGALVSDKEAAEVASSDQNAAAKAAEAKSRQMAESGMDDKKPVLSYDRRLPKNAKNKQHLLSRIHTIESTLQRLYGKLEADNEYPSVESIEQIMSSTIKQAVFTADQVGDVEAGGKAAATKGAKSATGKQQVTSDQDLEEPDEEEGAPGVEGEDGPMDDNDRRAKIRADRRRRMEERERMRSEKSSLEVKKPGASGAGGGKNVGFGNTSEERIPGDIDRLKQMQDEEDEELRMQPANMPAYGDHDDDVAAHKKMNLKGFDRSLGRSGTEGGDESPAHSPLRTTQRTGTAEDGGLSNEELQQMAASDDANAWKSAFSKVRHGKKNDLVSMLDAGCPTDLKDPAGNTLLNVAAQNGQKSIIKALLRRGAALNTQNHNGQTPLHFCFTYGYEDLGKYLISKGADDTVQNFSGLTCYEGLGE